MQFGTVPFCISPTKLSHQGETRGAINGSISYIDGDNAPFRKQGPRRVAAAMRRARCSGVAGRRRSRCRRFRRTSLGACRKRIAEAEARLAHIRELQTAEFMLPRHDGTGCAGTPADAPI